MLSKSNHMALKANRHNIKPMLFGIALVMMIMFCLLGTIFTLQVSWMCESAGSDRIGDSRPCLNPIWVSQLGVSAGFPISEFSLFRVAILVPALEMAFFTLTTNTSFFSFIFEKLRHRFDLFAMRTSLCYNRFSHFCFSRKQDWLEPVEARTSVGSFYNNGLMGKCQ